MLSLFSLSVGAQRVAFQVVAFSSLLLGFHSIALLQYAPSHSLLRSLAAATSKWMRQERELVQLESPLGEFSRRRRTQIASRRAAEKAARERVKVGGQGGPVGRSAGGRTVKAAREAAMDAHREVGPYAIEKLEL